MPNHAIPPLEEFLGGADSGPTYAGDPDVAALPLRDRRTPGHLVGRAHSRPTTVMNIVDSEGRGFPVDMAQVTQETVARAAVPAHAAASAEDAAVTTFHRLASGQRPVAQGRNPAYTPVVVTNLGAPAALPQRRRAVPMGQPEPGPAAPPPREAAPAHGYVEQGVARPSRPTLVGPPPGGPDGRVAPPAQQVTYEIPGYGPLDTFYHQVIRTGDHLVLVFDKRHVGQRGFPRHSEAELGMRVHGTDRLFSVRTTGIEFDLDTKALCLLQVTGEGSYSAYVDERDPVATAMNHIPFLAELGDGEVRQHRGGAHAPGDDHDAVPGL